MPAFLNIAAPALGAGLLGALAALRHRRRQLDDLETELRAMSERMARAVAQVSVEKAELEAILGHMAEAVASVDEKGRVLELNAALERLFGVRAEAARGRPFVEVVRQGPLQALLADTLASGQSHSAEVSLFTPEERTFEAQASPVPGAGGARGAVVVLHDVTRLKALERMRKEFVANVSHELRTPLASIQGYAETLRRGALDDKENRLEFVETIERHAVRLGRLVEDLLDLAAIESGRRPPRPEPIALKAFAAELFKELGPVADARRVTLENLVDDGITLRADRVQLRQVLQNLVDNAVKFNRDGGRVTLAVRRDKDELVLSVADTGLGVPAGDLPRLFERFYRVEKGRSREQGGTGLGLAIVKHVVEAHGGRVWAESDEGRGSTFFAAFPAAARSES